MMNRQIVLAARPTGAAGVEHFRLQEAPIPSVGEGEVLVKTSFFSVDPYMRMRMNDVKSYAPPQKLNEVMGGGSAGIVVESRFPGLVAGDAVVMVTATNEFVTHPIAQAFGVADLIALELERDTAPGGSGWITGEIKGVPSFREGKVTRVEQWLASRELAWGDVESTFYTDSINDLSLLEKVTHPVATNPDERLRAIASERGWRILDLFD